MKRTTKYVALDVHQATTVASVREESGRVIARTVLPTDGILIVQHEGPLPRPAAKALHVSLSGSELPDGRRSWRYRCRRWRPVRLEALGRSRAAHRVR